MESNTYIFSSLRESAARMTAGVEGDPKLTVGLILGSVVLGLASYIWAFWSQRSRLKVFKETISLSSVKAIVSGLFSLLLMDVANAIAAVILAVKFDEPTSIHGITYNSIYSTWFLFRCLGLTLHLLNALACLLFLCHPQWRANLGYVYSAVSLFISAFISVYFYFIQVTIFGLGAVTIGLALAIIAIAKCTVSDAPPSAATQKKLVVLVAMLTLLVVFTPAFILQCLIISAAKHGELHVDYLTIYENILLCTNFQLFLDGLLCYLMLKLPSEEEEQQQQQQQQQEEQQQHQSFENPNYAVSANATT